MLGTVVDDSGWESVGNVQFTSTEEHNGESFVTAAVPPPPEFSEETAKSLDSASENGHEAPEKVSNAADVLKNERPARQYVYGVDKENITKKNVIKPSFKSPLKATHENIIEAEIRLQQKREEELKRENDIRIREKIGGASSPSSHASDEGFVDRPIEDIPSPQLSTSSLTEGFTHSMKGVNGEVIIYDSVSPPSIYFGENSENATSSEAKIAMEIRELKEREAELRAMRELREREQEVRALQKNNNHSTSSKSGIEPDSLESTVPHSKILPLDDTSLNTIDRETSDEQHLASIPTSTDEGNFSEYGDSGSNEEKSSNASSSRMMSPDPQNGGYETRQKKVTVKPFEDEDNDLDEQPYISMRKESVIEREIRIAKEREEAFRREKGLLPPNIKSSTKIIPATPIEQQHNSTLSKNGFPNGVDSEVDAKEGDIQFNTINSSIEAPKKVRGVQQRLATTRIQQEIEENAMRERELISAGKIKTLSEDTVDSKVTRLVDFNSSKITSKQFQTIHNTTSVSPKTQNAEEVNTQKVTKEHISLCKKASSPVFSNLSSQCSKGPTSPTFHYDPPFPNRLTRSLSTNNLSVFGVCPPAPSMVNAQKGLMQKFIASRGKLTGTTFASTGHSYRNGPSYPTTATGIPTRPMRLFAKGPNASQTTEVSRAAEIPKAYRRKPATAEEKIQEELADFKTREEELRRLRAKNLARSQPNLADLDDDADYDCSLSSEGVDSSSFLHEMNSLKSALSSCNLLDDEAEQVTQQPAADRTVRRRSALIAQWEGLIQKTAET